MTTKSNILGAIAAVAAAATVAAYAYAQAGPGMGHGRMGGMGHGMMGEGMTGNAGTPAARLEAIKAELGIRPGQTSAWDAYAKVLTEVSGERRSLRGSVDRDAVHKMEPKDRQAFRESMRTQRDASISTVRTAAEALLAQLDDAQKDKARRTLPGLVAGGPGDGMHYGMMGGHGEGSGMGRGKGHHDKR